MNSKVIGLVDDEDIFHWIVRKHVEKLNEPCKFISFYNGDEIYQYLASNPEEVPDVLFLDINMPVCNGWRFLDKYSESEISTDISIYILSSSIDPQDLMKAKSYSAVKDYFSKPLTGDILKRVLEANEKETI